MADVIQKFYEYKVYRAGVYIGNYSRDEVISDFKLSQELNNAGSQLKISLARPTDNYGEGVDVDFRLKVKVYCYDSDAPNGLLVFQGFIADYTPIYGGEDSEHIEITLLGYGAELDDYLIMTGESLYLDNSAGGSVYSFSTSGMYENAAVYQSFQVPSNYSLSRIGVAIETGGLALSYGDTQNVVMALYSGTPTSPGTLLGSATKAITNTTLQTLTFSFGSNIALTAGANYYFMIYAEVPRPSSGGYNFAVGYSNANPYASGSMYVATNGSHFGDTITNYPTQDITFQLYITSGSTTAPYSSVDPSTILKSILDDYTSRGGTISYDATTIDMTGTSVSYTFNSNTTLEGIKKVLELAPSGWYFYIDQATNMLHFHKVSNSVAYRFTFGRDIVSLKTEKRIEDVVNTVYVTGGDTGAGILYKKYTDATSISLYGPKIYRYVDQRITVATTADIIGNTILQNRKAPEIRTVIDVVDNAGDPNSGFDIETIKPGDVVSFANVGQWDSNFWDAAVWDTSFWDYNITQLETLALQIVRLDRDPDKVSLSLSTVALDVNKRIEDINRNLQNALTVTNPSTPS